jgi:hypothetical protein
LREQAEAAPSADGLLVADAINTWNRERLSDLRALTGRLEKIVAQYKL